MSDPWSSKEAQDWIKHCAQEMIPKMADSAICVSLVTGNSAKDIKFCVELGAMIMMDKPVVVVATEGQTISKKLAAVADEIVFLPAGDPHGQEAAQRISAVISKLVKD